MKAATLRSYDGPGAIEVIDMPEPRPGAGEVLVDVRAASVNALDWRVARADPGIIRMMTGLVRPNVAVMGADIAGVVAELGPGVHDLQVGDKVFGEVGIKGIGGFAERAVIPQEHVARFEKISFEQASCLPVAGLTALQGMRDHGQVGPAMEVLVTGASGGVGHLAVQAARAFGAQVTAVTRHDHLDAVRKLGAATIDRETMDWTTTGPYDVIFDTAAYGPLKDRRRALADDGTYVMIGGSTKAMFGAMLVGGLIFRGKQRCAAFTAEPKADDLATLAAMADRGDLVPMIDHVYPLAETAAAVERLEQGRVCGKVVVRM